MIHLWVDCVLYLLIQCNRSNFSHKQTPTGRQSVSCSLSVVIITVYCSGQRYLPKPEVTVPNKAR